jgi:EAL domain-containing protein (putative c-di-GMP-specific phosphodiesterase class I)
VRSPTSGLLDSDRLLWGPNLGSVLGISELGALGSGRGFAQFIDPKSGTTRLDAVRRSTSPDPGGGVPYQVQYALRPTAGSANLLWIEDTGRWFAGPDGKPMPFRAYQPNLEREVQRRENVRATDEIMTALNARRIFLVYEPIIAAGSRQPALYECLMRVRRTDGTLLAVNEVVPAAERLGLLRLLDHRVLELALAELVNAPELKASLNVSAASTVDPDWWDALGAMLRAHKGVGERLTVEITETAAIHDVDDTRSFVARVKDLGCRIAIDDFGAGNTSFRNLRKLGVDLIKIDGAFVRDMRRSDDDRVFVQTLIELAQRLGLETVAEWVQDEETAAMLANWGCDYLRVRWQDLVHRSGRSSAPEVLLRPSA